MKLTILGGGGFRVPLVFKALIADEAPGRVTELRLYDTDATRLEAIRSVLDELAEAAEQAPGGPPESGQSRLVVTQLVPRSWQEPSRNCTQTCPTPQPLQGSGVSMSARPAPSARALVVSQAPTSASASPGMSAAAAA